MTAPSPVVRAVTYERDLERCVSCGARVRLQWQHRQRVGMGGSGRKAPRVGFVDGVTSCAVCNDQYENALQAKALRFGWKVRAWVKDPGLVPVWYPLERSWFVLLRSGKRMPTTPGNALVMMVAVYGDEYEQMVEAAA